jgi:signal transduction histidine kinase
MNNSANSLGLMVADMVPAMLAYWDNQLICRYANESYLEWFGMNKIEMVDKISIADLFGETYGPYEPHVSAVLSGTPQELVLVVANPGKKSKRYLQVSFFPDVDVDVVKGFVMHAADITPVKELEKRIKKSNDTIKAQNKSLLNFANIVTHDLRGYTYNLEGLLELFENELNEHERKVIFDNIKDLSALFKTTVKNLSDVVAVQNMGDIPVEEVNLFECVNKAVEVLGPQIKETGTTVNIKVSPFVYIDANHEWPFVTQDIYYWEKKVL